MNYGDVIPEEVLSKRLKYEKGFLTTVFDSRTKSNRIVYKYPVNEGSTAYITATATKEQQTMYKEIMALKALRVGTE